MFVLLQFECEKSRVNFTLFQNGMCFFIIF